MDERKPSPEEQLLKLIENPTAAAKPETSAAATSAAKGFSFGKFFGFLAYLRHQNPKKEIGETGAESRPLNFNIKGINAILVAGVLAAGIYLVLDMTVLKKNTAELLTDVSTANQLQSGQVGESAPVAKHDVAYYQQLIDRRNPFLAGSAKPVIDEKKPAPLAMPPVQSDKMAKVMQSIKLVGISWSGEIPLAMIEQVESGKTLFLKEGQEINHLKVQHIDKEKVTVTYDGEEAILF